MIATVRASLAETLRSRVAGEDRSERAARIFEDDGPRWFDADSPIRRVHADAAMFPGGIRALLLQSLHPLAMAGVAGHSGYRGDPWGRLQRTSEYLAATTFGPEAVALEAIERVASVHQRVRGRADDGSPYSADDPRLLGWVHAAEIDSFLTAFQHYAATPLTDDEADTYVAQSARAATLLGVADAPLTRAELDETIASYRPELRATPAARDAARFLLLNPPLPLAARPGYAALAAGAVALLPLWTRRELNLPWLPGADLAIGRPIGRAATGAVRWAMGAPGNPHHGPSGRRPQPARRPG